jgi:uncharacterized repeat protein (TIGR04138 family)
VQERKSFSEAIEEIIQKDNRYSAAAYAFLMEALNFTMKKLPKPMHVTGQELLEGIKVVGLKEFGPMARSVFEHWGIKKTDDFGEMVFNMVDAGLMSKTEKDSKEDFRGVYDFEEVFEKDYEYGTGVSESQQN